MTKTKIQKLVEQIHKYAAPVPPPPDAPGAAPAPVAPAGGVPTPRPAGPVPNQSVRLMQSSIYDLAQIVESTNFPALNKFITKQYAKSLGTNQADSTQINAMMDTMRRITNPGKGEAPFRADGSWGPITDKALHNMADFAEALLSLQAALKLGTEAYTAANLDQFNENLLGYQVTKNNITLGEKDKTERADKITSHLKAIARMYNDFKRQIIQNPELRETVLDKGALTDEEQKLVASDTKTPEIFQFKGYEGGDASKPIVIKSVPLSALTSVEQFDNFLRSIGYTDNDDATNLDRWRGPIINLIVKELSRYNPKLGI